MVTIKQQIKIVLDATGKEWVVPEQFIKEAQGCEWAHWFQLRASHPGLASLLFPGLLASNCFVRNGSHVLETCLGPMHAYVPKPAALHKVSREMV